jgi:RNA polymerase sigma-70 factor (ECF subfamily)
MGDHRTRRFDALVTPHLAVLYRVAYRLVRNSADAHDLVQDACISACEHLDDLQATTRPDRWLLRVLQNRFLNQLKRRRRVPFVPLDDAPDVVQLPSSAAGPEELLLQSDDERALARALLRLDDTQRTLLALRAEGYGLTEIESITGIGRQVLRARLHRARNSLARHLALAQGDDAPRVVPMPRSAS